MGIYRVYFIINFLFVISTVLHLQVAGATTPEKFIKADYFEAALSKVHKERTNKYFLHNKLESIAAPTQIETIPISTAISGLWANEGGDKVTQDELRQKNIQTQVFNHTWDGREIQIFGARNEIVSFNVILEAADEQANAVSISFNKLTGPGGYVIKSSPANGDGVFDWTNRDIELFYIRYLQIKGLSKLSYDSYDERHIPERFRRPWTGAGKGTGLWIDRPDHDKYYPDIAVPLELVPNFIIEAGQNQSVWADIYIPKDAPAGIYTGSFEVFESGVLSHSVPVKLKIRNFSLPDTPYAKTMLYLGYDDIVYRYFGNIEIKPGFLDAAKLQTIRNRHFMMAHRHRISLFDSNHGEKPKEDWPANEWIPRLNGSLFTKAEAYRGPGEGIGNDIFVIGAYGSWNWKTEGKAGMWAHTDTWVNWFTSNSPLTEYFLFLIDESANTSQMQTWAFWMDSNPSVGSKLSSMATISAPLAGSSAPNLDIITSLNTVGDANTWQKAVNEIKASGRRFYSYNGFRPASGSFATEDDGIALRELAWGQFKMGIQSWFSWHSTYYHNYQGGMRQTDVFTEAQTFGSATNHNEIRGDTGWNYTNGDGVLFYPGTEKLFKSNNYYLNGPIASLRLKHWRRGIQDVDYLNLATAINPTAVRQIVNTMIPKVLWENGVGDIDDPSWQNCDISWSSNPDLWEEAREKLANIIESGSPHLNTSSYRIHSKQKKSPK